MSNTTITRLEQALVKVFEYMKDATDDTTKIPKFSSIGLQHLLDVTKFVEDFADTTFLPWVAENDPSGSIDAGIPTFISRLYDDVYKTTSKLLAEYGYGEFALDKFQEKFTQQQPWYVDDLHVVRKIVEMLIDGGSCEMKSTEEDE